MAPVVTDAGRLAAVVGIAVLSSVIPYAIEQVVLRRVSAARFAILLALLPVTAAVTGAVLLSQLPTCWRSLGMVLICAAIVLSAQRQPVEPAPPVQDGPIRRSRPDQRRCADRLDQRKDQPRLLVSKVLQAFGFPDW